MNSHSFIINTNFISLQITRNDRLVNLGDVNTESLTTVLASNSVGLVCLQNITHLKLHGDEDYEKHFFTTLHVACGKITHLSLNGDGYGNAIINQEALDELRKFPLINV